LTTPRHRPPTTGERFEALLQCRNLVIERISSSAVIAPNQYIQTQDEWVLLVQGTAEIEIDGKTESLKSGDYFFLPANSPHSVKKVSDGALWLAIHLHQQ
jgi:cupin 2 domain-containing protein